MKNILLSLTLFYAAVSVCAIVKALREPFEQPGLVRLPKWLLLFGIPGTAIFLIVPWCTFGKINTATFAFALLLTFLPFSLTLAYLNCRVKYNDRTFMRRTLLGWRSTFCYEDITGICGWENTVTLYIGSRCVMLDRYALGRREFLEAAKTRYNQCYRRPIPAVRARSDIFRGNLKNPGEMLLCICLLLVFTLLFVPFTFFIARVERPMLTEVRFSAASCSISDDNLYLSDGRTQYRLLDYAEVLTDAESFLQRVRSREELTFHCMTQGLGTRKPYCTVYAVEDAQGRTILPFETVSAHNRHADFVGTSIMTGVLAAFVLPYVGLFLCVSRHPERYPQRFCCFIIPRRLWIWQPVKKTQFNLKH